MTEYIPLIAMLIYVVASELNNSRRLKQEKMANESLIRYMEKKEADWNIERQQLLDRIQAPSYDHLKHHEAKIIKASKDPLKEPNTLEVV